MRKRKPVNVKSFSIVHNAIMFFASLYMVIETLRQVCRALRASIPRTKLLMRRCCNRVCWYEEPSEIGKAVASGKMMVTEKASM